MADRTARILIGVEADTESAKTQIADFSARMDALTATFEEFAVVGESVGSKIAEGQRVSASEVDALTEAFAGLSTEVKQAFPAEAPEELTSAMRVAKSQIAALADSVQEVPKELNKIEPAADKAGDSIGTALRRVDANLENLKRELNDTGDVGKGELEKITKSQALLEMEIRNTVGSYDKLDAESKKAYDRIQKEADEARKTVIQLEKANEDVERSVNGAVRGYMSLDDAMDQVRQRLGNVGMAATAAGGAFATGWAAGMAINDKLKTDMSEWDALLTGIGNRASLIIRAISDNIVATGGVVGAIFESISTGSFEPLKRSIKEAEDTGVQTGQMLTTAFTGTAEAVNKTAVQFGVASQALDAHKAAQVAAAEAAAKATELAKAQAEEQARLAEAVRKVNADLVEQQRIMDNAESAASLNRAQGAESADQLRNTAGQIQQLEQTLKGLSDRLASQVSQYGENSAAAKNTAAEIAQYESQLRMLEQRHDSLSDKLENYRAKEDEATAAAERAREQAAALQKQKEDLAGETKKLSGTQEESIFLLDHETVKLDAAKQKQAEYRTETVLVTDAVTGAKTVTQQLIKVTEENTAKQAAQTDEQKKAKTVVDETTKALQGLAGVSLEPVKKEAQSLKEILDLLAASARQARIDMDKLAGAGGDAAGEDDGISIRRSGSSTELGKGDTLGGGFKSASAQPGGF